MLVGLTGGIGSGKSTVAKIFKSFGVPVFNSDDEARQIVNTDENVMQQIKAVFEDVYKNGQLNRTRIAEIVFNDRSALEKLNEIVHPAVGAKFKRWVDENRQHSVLIKEAAILIESDTYKELDKMILVKASKQTKIERVMKRNNISEEKVRGRMENQMSDKEKEQYCDYFINNDNEMLMPQVLKIYKQLKSPD